MDSEKQQDVDKRGVWKRGLFMLLFAVAFAVAQTLLNLLAVVQFLWLLFASEPTERPSPARRGVHVESI